ncbi:MAG: DNA starvation/stationary phase protection protein Dps [Pseudomonadota bacterium]|nr:DNA starvation/stationary phase protection protein Dps [Pseudomonadota bacterium]
MEEPMPAQPKAKSRPDAMIALLNQSLAGMLDLKLSAKQAHWNVKGENFIALHELFDKVATETDAYADSLAERAVQLGGVASGTSQQIVRNSKLSPYPASIQASNQHVKALGAATGLMADQLRKAIDTADEAGDMVTADLFTQITGGLDKLRWFIEAHA